MNEVRYLELDEIIARLRRSAAIWLKNDDLLVLEELIRRVNILRSNQKESSSAGQ